MCCSLRAADVHEQRKPWVPLKLNTASHSRTLFFLKYSFKADHGSSSLKVQHPAERCSAVVLLCCRVPPRVPVDVIRVPEIVEEKPPSEIELAEMK